MSAIDKITAFSNEYKAKISQVEERYAACSQRIEELQLEARFIREKEIPEASVNRVLNGDGGGQEAKLKKSLAKLEVELVEKQEELVILENALTQYKLKSAEEVRKMQQLFKNERKIAADKAYRKMMAAKREYVETMKAEAEVLHRFAELDMRIQEVEYAAGIRNGVYSGFEVDSATIPGNADRHNGVYLALTHDEVKKIIKNTARPSELEYLDKYKNVKGL